MGNVNTLSRNIVKIHAEVSLAIFTIILLAHTLSVWCYVKNNARALCKKQVPYPTKLIKSALNARSKEFTR